MLTHPTLDQLHQLGLSGMAKAFGETRGLRRAATLTHPEWLALLLDREIDLPPRQEARRPAALCQAAPAGRRRGCRLSRRARPRSRAVPEARQRRLDRRPRQSDLSAARPASAKVGSPARSATRPAATIAPSSISASPSCSAISRSRAATAAMPASLRALGGVQLLILDDWGLEPLDAGARHDLLEILEERYGRRSTIITSQLPVDNWHERDRRSDLCRRHPRPPRPQRPPHRSHRRQPAPDPTETSQKD